MTTIKKPLNRQLDIKNTIYRNIVMIPKTAEQKGWSFTYDPELDNLYLSPEKIPSDASLTHLDDEIAIYLRPNLEISGIFIEYLSRNFLKHNKEFKCLLDLFSKSKRQQNVKIGKRDEAILYQNALITKILKYSENRPEFSFK